MAAFEPFEANVKTSVAGQTIFFSATSASQGTTLDSTNSFAPCLLVTVGAPQNAIAYLRLSTESSATATTTDTPLPGGPNPLVRLFANPAPNGITAIAVICTVTSTPVKVWITPGQGGIA